MVTPTDHQPQRQETQNKTSEGNMSHLEVACFIISVYEAGIYDTNILGGFCVERISLGWDISYE